MPRPGFMRQLQALDASLQRVIKAGAAKNSNSSSHAGGGGDQQSMMRRYTDWDPNLLSE